MRALQASEEEISSQPSDGYVGRAESGIEGIVDSMQLLSAREISTRLFFLIRLTTGAFHSNWLKHSPVYSPNGVDDDENAIPPGCIVAFIALLLKHVMHYSCILIVHALVEVVPKTGI